jgi:hypothetical protein
MAAGRPPGIDLTVVLNVLEFRIMRRLFVGVAVACLASSVAFGQANQNFNSVLPTAVGLPALLHNRVFVGAAGHSGERGPFNVAAAATSGGGSNTTGTIAAASPILTVAAATDFANGQGIRVNHAGASVTLNPPTGARVIPTGATGATAYAYTIASLNATGGVGQSIGNVTTAAGNARLSTTNYNTVRWTAATGTAPAAYAVYGNKAGTLALIGIVPFGTNTFNDTGGGAITAPDWLPTTPQTKSSLASWLITTIASGGGTTTLTLAASAATAAAAQFVIHDDTANLQAAITSAQKAGNVLFVPPGTYQVTTPLRVTGRLTLLGSGYQGDSGKNNIGGSGSYNSAANMSRGSGWRGTTFVCGILNNCINVATNDAIDLEKFQITYPVRAVRGVTGIDAAAAAGGTSNNTASNFRDIFISGPDTAMKLTNFINFNVDHVTLAPWTNSITISVPNYPSFGDSSIQNSLMYGRNIASHIVATSVGGLRVINNKLVSGNYGILLQANLAGNQFEPELIVVNSFEGQTTAVSLLRGRGSTTQASQIVIAGNQFYVGATCIDTIYGAAQWITAMSIVGNMCVMNSRSGVGYRLDGGKDFIVSGNTFANSSPKGIGIVLGAHQTNTNVQSNKYDSGLTKTVNNAGGVTNAIGGGSS